MPARRYMLAPQGSGPPPPPPITRRWNPGWYPTLQFSQLTNAAPYIPNAGLIGSGQTAGIINSAGPCAPGANGFLLPINWDQIEPTAGTFNFARIDAFLAACATYNTGNSPNGMQLVIKFTTKSFGTPINNPLPADLQVPSAANNNSPDGFATAFAPGGPIPPGICVWRWHPVIVARIRACFLAIGAHCGSHPNFAGIATQETSTSYVPVPAVDSYSVNAYRDALVAECKATFDSSALIRPYPFINFMGQLPGSTSADQAFALAQFASQVQQYAAVLSFSDLVTNLAAGAIPSRVYQIMNSYHFGTNFTNSVGTVTFNGKPGATAGSIQGSEWTGDGKAPPADPSPVSIPDLYNYATESFKLKPSGAVGSNGFNDPNFYARDHRSGTPLDSPLNLDIIFIDWHTGNTQTNALYPPAVFNPNGSDIILAEQIFGSVTPNP